MAPLVIFASSIIQCWVIIFDHSDCSYIISMLEHDCWPSYRSTMKLTVKCFTFELPLCHWANQRWYANTSIEAIKTWVSTWFSKHKPGMFSHVRNLNNHTIILIRIFWYIFKVWVFKTSISINGSKSRMIGIGSWIWRIRRIRRLIYRRPMGQRESE